MDFFRKISQAVGGFFLDLPSRIKELPQALKAGFSHIAEWSVSTKIIVGLSSAAIVALGITAGVMIHGFSSGGEATADGESVSVEMSNLAQVGVGIMAYVPDDISMEEVVEEVSDEEVTAALPELVACKLSSDSLEKDLTLYIKGVESGKKIKGTKFEVKLISTKSESSLTQYTKAIKDVNARIDDAKKGGTIDKESTEQSTSSDGGKLTVGQQLATEKQEAIDAYKKALMNVKGDTYTDTDSDGMIYIKSIDSGDYIACFVPVSGYDASEYTTKVNVKDKVEYKKVENIEDKTVSAAAAGDAMPAEAAQVEAVLTDTVEFVNSTKTLVSGGSSQASPKTLAPAKSGTSTDSKEFTPPTAKKSGGVTYVSAAVKSPKLRLLTSGTDGDNSGSDGSTGGSGDSGNTTGSGDSSSTTGDGGSSGSDGSTGSSGDSGDTTGGGDSGGTTGGGDSGSDTTPTTPTTVKTDTAISLSATSLSLKVGGGAGTVTASGANITGFSAASQNTSVATVSVSGGTITVTPVAAGTATVTVSGTVSDTNTYNPPSSVSFTVTVTASAAKATGTLSVPQSVTLYAKDGINTIDATPSLSNATISEVVSSNANALTAKLDSSGKVTLTALTSVTANTSVTVTYTAKCSDGSTVLTAKTAVTVVGSGTAITDANGSALYTDEACTKAATVANYGAGAKFYVKGGNEVYKYTGWQVINGNSYYYTKDGNVVTGSQVIQGVKYNFGTDGALLTSGNGIDVSKWQGNIDWSQTKTAVSFAIIRCGFRGTGGGIAVDPTFATNAKNAKANGVKIGLYFYSRATTEAQAVEEASLAVQCAQQAGGLSYPIFIDMESSEQSGLSNEQRTAIVNAFCTTVRNSGYSAGLYANKNWLTSKINTGSLSGIKIWCAQYNTTCTYAGHKDMWQYSSKGSVPGISGNVDMNISYF